MQFVISVTAELIGFEDGNLDSDKKELIEDVVINHIGYRVTAEMKRLANVYLMDGYDTIEMQPKINGICGDPKVVICYGRLGKIWKVEVDPEPFMGLPAFLPVSLAFLASFNAELYFKTHDMSPII